MYLLLLALASTVSSTSSRMPEEPPLPPPPPTTTLATPVECQTLPPLPPLHKGKCKCGRSQLHCEEGTSVDVALALGDPCGQSANSWTIIHGTNITDLRFLPDPCNLGMLDVSHNQISSVAGSLSKCHGLWLLDLSHNPLGYIPERIFEKMSMLGYLLLDHAQLRHVDEDTFLGQYGLVSLKLSHNRLNHVPQHSFKDLWNVNVIDLSHNRLLLLPDLLFRRTLSLRFLLVNENRLTHIQSELFTGLEQLQYLNMSNNQIRFLQTEIFEGLHRLTRLDVRNNVLQEIPMFRNCCAHLDYVDFQKNRITSPTIENVKTLLRLGEVRGVEVDARKNNVSREALCRLLRAGGAYAPCDRRNGPCLRGRLGRCRAFGGCYWMRLHETNCKKGPDEEWHWDYDYDAR